MPCIRVLAASVVALLSVVGLGCDRSGDGPIQIDTDPSNEAMVVNSIGMRFQRVPAGSFQMGSTRGQDDEQPVHAVTISQDFYLGVFEVTQAQWTQVMDRNPSTFVGPFRPVETVSWNDVQVFLERLNARENTTRYRLPSEAEWEYAARGGTQTLYSFGDSTADASAYAWYLANSNRQTITIGQRRSNPFGLHDVHGNVWEWVQDAYDPTYYRRSPGVNPANSARSSARSLRGGGWFTILEDLRTANRGWARADLGSQMIGFRVLREIPDDGS
jgi:formylglycine-generating enzyme required for sulfatase activity